tara:strand:+ start:3110 stop:3862 length:753 start_codon:yes stop_codon:yes gene_type:complete
MSARFGQHFLTDSAVIDRIIASLPKGDFDSVIEIGPGKGAITKRLINLFPENLHLIELDKRLLPKLESRFSSAHIFNEDAVKFDYNSVSGENILCVGNLPYEISSPLLFALSEYTPIKEMYFMVQHEFALRAVASKGKEVGRLSFMLQVFFHVFYDWEVLPEAFSPPPKVLSAMMHLQRRDKPLTTRIRELDYLLKLAFSKRRKMLRQIFKNVDVDFSSLEINPEYRPEQVSLSQWVNWAEVFQLPVEPQ